MERRSTLKEILRLWSVAATSALAASALTLRAVEQDAPSGDEPLRVRGLEVVDAEGRPCVVLRAGTNGGSTSWLRPTVEDERGEPHHIAYIGGGFSSFSDFVLNDPTGEWPAQIAMSVGGEPSSPSITVSRGRKTPLLQVGGPGTGPTLRVHDAAGELVLAK